MKEELIQLFKNGNKQAGDDFYNANIKLVYYAARVYKPKSIDSDETFALVNQAFAKSMKAYDPHKGTFATYFMRSARGCIGNHCRDLAYMIRTRRKDFAETKQLVYCDSLNEVYFKDDSTEITLQDRFGIEDDYSQIIVEEILKDIEEVDREIVTLYYTKKFLQKEIGKMLGIRQVQVSRSLTKSKAMLKVSLKEVS